MKKTKAGTGRKIKASGIIVPAEWDSNGNVIGYAISTFNEKEYLVNYDIGSVEDLECFLGKKVSIEGVLLQSVTPKTIRVNMIAIT